MIHFDNTISFKITNHVTLLLVAKINSSMFLALHKIAECANDLRRKYIVGFFSSKSTTHLKGIRRELAT